MVVMATRGLGWNSGICVELFGHQTWHGGWCLEGLHHPEFGLDVVESLYCRRVTWL